MARAHVGFEEEDWRFLVFISTVCNVTISDLIRESVAAYRKQADEELRAEGSPPGWITDNWNKQ